MIEARIDAEDPFLLSMAPVCGPWSPLHNLNETRESFSERLQALRQQWYPVIKWLTDVIRKRLQKGREVMMENPWPSRMWSLRCMLELLEDYPYNNFTGERLEL